MLLQRHACQAGHPHRQRIVCGQVVERGEEGSRRCWKKKWRNRRAPSARERAGPQGGCGAVGRGWRRRHTHKTIIRRWEPRGKASRDAEPFGAVCQYAPRARPVCDSFVVCRGHAPGLVDDLADAVAVAVGPNDRLARATIPPGATGIVLVGVPTIIATRATTAAALSFIFGLVQIVEGHHLCHGYSQKGGR